MIEAITQRAAVQLPAIKLMGISCRTSNAAEMNPSTAKIGPTVQQYHALATQLNDQQWPGEIYHVYTAYESDFNGEYTFFIGQKIPTFGNIPANFQPLTIPAQQYVKFTAGPGKSLEVCIGLWQKIWKMKPAELGGERAYIADIEVYDERATDPQHTILDIMIGIK
jgi:predicted transcriptional regulator YdeE